MPRKKYDWSVRGDCVEGCTSPPVCPAYWGSPMQAQFHGGQSQCEGVWTFNIIEGHYGDVNLGGLLVSYGFSSPSPFPSPNAAPWQSIIYIDQKANIQQAEALEKIYRMCWMGGGEPIMTKRARITFKKELVDGGPAAKHWVQIDGIYQFAASPLIATNKKPRYIISPRGGRINVGISEVNEFNDPDLPRGKWNASRMSSTYCDFVLNPDKQHWLP
jgi:hypothetical protein